MRYSEELLRALAHGDKEAQAKIKHLPLSERLSIGVAVDTLRTNENIVPMDPGNGIYAKQEQKEDSDVLGDSLRRILDEKNAKEAEKLRVQEENLQKRAKYEADRARAGLWR